MAGWSLSPLAVDDLIEILDYLADEAGINVADKVEIDFYAAFDLLAHSPRIGYRDEDLTGPGVRRWVVHRYLVFYDPETIPLRVLRIIHGMRDLPTVLRRSGQ